MKEVSTPVEMEALEEDEEAMREKKQGRRKRELLTFCVPSRYAEACTRLNKGSGGEADCHDSKTALETLARESGNLRRVVEQNWHHRGVRITKDL